MAPNPSSSSSSSSSAKINKPDVIEINPAFRYLGIPRSWLGRRKMPSVKTTAFLFSCGSLISLYVYDRQRARKIQQEHVEQVRHLAEALVSDQDFPGARWMPRKVTVYGARVPEDVDVDRGTQWFKKFIKPILVAAAIDYTIHDGTSPGALARKISTDIRDRRVIEAAQKKDRHQPSALVPGMPGFQEWHAEQRRMAGGTIILGRAAWKEYLWGLEDGYKRVIPLNELDDDEQFSKQLEDHGIFETTEQADSHDPKSSTLVEESAKHNWINEGSSLVNDSAGTIQSSPFSRSQSSSLSSYFHVFSRSSPQTSPPQRPLETHETPILAPAPIPPQPPVLLVPFDHPIGIRWWPLKIYRFFNRRQQAQLGAETAMKLIESQTRAIEPPHDLRGLNQLAQKARTGVMIEDVPTEHPEFGVILTGSKDLDFLAPDADDHLRRSYRKVARNVIQERSLFRKDLQRRLEQARTEHDQSFSSDEPAPQQDVLNESQLRQEAFQKEKKWSDQLFGWALVRQGSGVCWCPEMADALKIFDRSKNGDLVTKGED